MAFDRERYPKCKYHASAPAVVVADPDEEKALGPGWFDHPDLVADVPQDVEGKTPEIIPPVMQEKIVERLKKTKFPVE